jgi:surface polysaccharide O-acyltransferase-like enzyme
MADALVDPPHRELSADLYRVVAVLMVVTGHWLVAAVTYRSGRFGYDEVLAELPWTQWLTWLFQVVPVFFVVGGYANAASWTRRCGGDGLSQRDWLRHRVVGIVGPATAYVVVLLIAVATASQLGLDGSRLAMPMWVLALHLWFLPIYLGVVSLTPLAVAAHRRWGLKVPATLAVAVAAVDVRHVPALGWVNYPLCWGAIYQLGVAWHGGALVRRRALVLAIGSAAVLTLAIWLDLYPVSMIGVTGQAIQNTSPPTIALLALAGVQAGLLLAVAPTVTAWLQRMRWRHVLTVANENALALYLWHMVPVVVVALTCYPSGWVPQPDLGTGLWWQWRLVWVAVLTVVTAMEMTLLWLARSVFARPIPVVAVSLPIKWSEPLMAVGAAAAAYSLWRFAAHGFAPDGHLPVAIAVIYLIGVVLVSLNPIGSRSSRMTPTPGFWESTHIALKKLNRA